MTADVVTVDPTATVADIARILLEHDIRSVPVVDIGGVVVGMVGEGDLISRAGYRSVRHHHLADLIDEAMVERRRHWADRVRGLTAEEIMTTDMVSCSPAEPVTAVSRRMLRRDVRAVPVIGHGRLVGMLSRHDLLRLFDRSDADIRTDLESVLADPLWAPADHRVEPTVRDGVVILEGTVRFPFEVGVVASTVRQIPGVVEVVNRLSSREEQPAGPWVAPPLF